MKFIPHRYQEFAIRFIKEHPEALLLLDMGLGKTVIALTAIRDLLADRPEGSKALVIAPLRVASGVWPEEQKKWDELASLRMSVMVGDAKRRAAALKASADVYVINRENVKWLTDYLERHGMPWPFGIVVIDELSGFKNPGSRRWQALRKVRPYIERVIGLTGTPAGNGLMDLWAEVFLIDRGKRLGRYFSRFRDRYFKPAAMNPCTGVVYSYAPLPGAEEQIYQQIADLSVSMRAKDYLNMPECLTVTHRVELDPEDRRLYNALKEYLLVEVGEDRVTADNAAALSGKLLQMANGAVYSADGEVKHIHDRKLEALLDLIEQANGRSVLVCYWFRHDRRRIQKFLAAKGIAARELKSNNDFADWNAGRIPVALISPAAAGHGLNIQQGGHILIWFSLVWSLELYAQTNARLWRQGQKEVVTIHHLVARNTVDEAVLKALEQKDCTQQRLIEAVKANISLPRGTA